MAAGCAGATPTPRLAASERASARAPQLWRPTRPRARRSQLLGLQGVTYEDSTKGGEKAVQEEEALAIVGEVCLPYCLTAFLTAFLTALPPSLRAALLPYCRLTAVLPSLREVDRVYLNTPSEAFIVDEPAGSALKILKMGFADAVVWNIGKERAGPWPYLTASLTTFLPSVLPYRLPHCLTAFLTALPPYCRSVPAG